MQKKLAGTPRALNLLLTLVSLSGCSHVPRDVKVYELHSKEGLVRKQASEVLPFDKADGFYCVSPSDLERIAQACVVE